MVGNKSDLFDKEMVSEEEALDYAKEIGASYTITSALNGTNIDDLFYKIGCKFLDPNYNIMEEDDKDSMLKGRIKLDEDNFGNKDKKCC